MQFQIQFSIAIVMAIFVITIAINNCNYSFLVHRKFQSKIAILVMKNSHNESNFTLTFFLGCNCKYNCNYVSNFVQKAKFRSLMKRCALVSAEKSAFRAMEPMWHKYQNFSQQLQFLTECNCNYIINFCVKRKKISITYVKVHTCKR